MSEILDKCERVAKLAFPDEERRVWLDNDITAQQQVVVFTIESEPRRYMVVDVPTLESSFGFYYSSLRQSFRRRAHDLLIMQRILLPAVLP